MGLTGIRLIRSGALQLSRRVVLLLLDAGLQFSDGLFAVALELVVEVLLVLALFLDLLAHLLHHGDHLSNGISSLLGINAVEAARLVGHT